MPRKTKTVSSFAKVDITYEDEELDIRISFPHVERPAVKTFRHGNVSTAVNAKGEVVFVRIRDVPAGACSRSLWTEHDSQALRQRDF